MDREAVRVGTASSITRDDMGRMTARAQAELAQVPPVTVTPARVLYHPGAIAQRLSRDRAGASP